MRPKALPLGILALALAACPKAEEPAEALPADAPAPAKTSTATAPPDRAFTLPLEPGRTCRYVLKDILTESLGRQPAAGHQATVTYTLTTESPRAGRLTYVLDVEHVKLTGKREGYSVKLDSKERGDMVRVRGGADTLLMFEGILYFALLDRPVRFIVDERGHLVTVKGADAARQALVDMHPPKPREDMHHRGKAKLALSDERLARRFVPSAVLIPEEGPARPRTIGAEEGTEQFPDYAAKRIRAARIRWLDGDLLLEEKRAFAASDAAPVVPARDGLPEVTFLGGQDETTVAMRPGDPCFTRAGRSFERKNRWRGRVEDEAVTTEQILSGTWLHERADDAR